MHKSRKSLVLVYISQKKYPVRQGCRMLYGRTGNFPLDRKPVFQAMGNFSGSDREWQILIQFYNGNPLILELVAHQVLERHLERLARAEKEIIYCLATN